MPESTQSNKKLIVIVVALVIIAGVVLLADALKGNSTSTSATAALTTPSTTVATTSTTTDDSAASTASTTSSSYKDGTYSASSTYAVPSGSESIKVNVTLSSGTITDVSIVNTADDHDSAEYQAEFAASYKSAVVGQKISSLKLTNIGGASDTTQGFNNALSQISTQAEA